MAAEAVDAASQAAETGNKFADGTLHPAFAWRCDSEKVVKQVKKHLQGMMLERPGNRTAIEWSKVEFVSDGVILPSKQPRTWAATYAWWKRCVLDPLALGKDQGELVGFVPQASRRESSPVASGQPSTGCSQPFTSDLVPIAANRDCFPAWASLKLLQGHVWDALFLELCVVGVVCLGVWVLESGRPSAIHLNRRQTSRGPVRPVVPQREQGGQGQLWAGVRWPWGGWDAGCHQAVQQVAGRIGGCSGGRT